jgi:CheY-like chemotaxis protein
MQASAQSNGAGEPGARVLIAEDEALVARDLQHTLEDLGYHVVGTVARSDDAVACAREMSPDLVLMDIRLEGEPDGIEAVRRLRRECDAAVIYLTAYTPRNILLVIKFIWGTSIARDMGNAIPRICR